MYPIVAREPLRCRWVERIVTPNKCDDGTQIWTKTRSVNGYVQVNEGSPVNLPGGSLRIKGQKGSLSTLNVTFSGTAEDIGDALHIGAFLDGVALSPGAGSAPYFSTTSNS